MLFLSILGFSNQQEKTSLYLIDNKLIIDGALNSVFEDHSSSNGLQLCSGLTSSCFVQARHLHPDEKREGRFLSMNNETRFVPFNQSFYCVATDKEFSFSDEVQKIRATIGLEGRDVVAKVYGLLDSGEALFDSAKLTYKPLRCDKRITVFEKQLKNAKLFRQDCLYDKYAGSIFTERKGKYRLLLDNKMHFIDESECYVVENHELIQTSNIKDRIVLQIKPDQNGANLHLFSPSGQECLEIYKKFEPVRPFFTTNFFKEVQLISPEMVKCRILDKRVTLKKGDWFFIREDKSIHPLRNFNEIQNCISSLLAGSLVIIDQIQQTNNHEFVIFGHFFDQTRQSMGIIRQVIKDKN